MKKSPCEILLHFFPDISEFEDLRSTYVTNCVFTNLLCYTAIVLNIVTIHAIRKTYSLPNTLKVLLLSLAVSDVGFSLVGQPFYISLLVRWLQQNDPGCSTYKVFVTITQFFTAASFLSVVLVSVERFLAIHLHLRYQELVTHKRVVAVVISIWALSVLIPFIGLWAPGDIYYATTLILGVMCLLVTSVVYIRIYLAVRSHKNQIQALQLQPTAKIADFASLVKSAFGIFYVYIVFLLCYLPHFISLAIFKINGPSITLKIYFLFSFTLVFLNSSLNPVIYCLKMRHIRHAIMDILRNIPWPRNRESH